MIQWLKTEWKRMWCHHFWYHYDTFHDNGCKFYVYRCARCGKTHTEVL